MTVQPHMVIIGAGIVGAAIAYRMTQCNARVTVVDASKPAAMATGAPFGWINASFFANPDHFHLCHAAIAAHHRLDADLGG